MKNLYLLAALLCVCTAARTQEITPQVIAASGSHFESTSSQLSWTLGETFIDSYEQSAVQLTQGFHQPQATSTAILEWYPPAEPANVWPNPSNGQFQVEWQAAQSAHLTVFNALGQVVYVQRINAGTHQISLRNAAPGLYLVQLESAQGNRLETHKLHVSH